jgi:hypothetical protein
MKPKAYRANDPADWGKTWRDPREDPNTTAHINPWYPTDGRDTVYPPYERLAPTGTIGELVAASKRVRDDDPTLPPKYASYLAQRTDVPHDKLTIFPKDTPLNARGQPVFPSDDR